MRKNQKGFSEIVLILIVVVFFGVVGFFIYNSSQRQLIMDSVSSPAPTPNTNNTGQNIDNNFFRQGEIIVEFKKSVTKSQALTLLRSHTLSPANSAIFFKYEEAWFYTKESKLDFYIKKIRQFEFVSSVSGLSNLDSTVLKSSVLTVKFSHPVSDEEIQLILDISQNLQFDNGHGLDTGHAAKVKVSIGKEEYWVDRLSREPEIESASTIYSGPID